MKPDYIAQGDNARTPAEINNWYDAHHRKAQAEGAKRTRLSVMYLFEAWNDDIKDSEMDAPRFTLSGER
jgi:hypothetical protein